MKVIENNVIPFPGFLGINLFGLLFVRKDSWARKSEEQRKVTFTHESIHTEQMKELGFVFFYLIYFFEWFVRLIINGSDAYDNISFEKEAYAHENDPNYLTNRKRYAQWRFKQQKTEA